MKFWTIVCFYYHPKSLVTGLLAVLGSAVVALLTHANFDWQCSVPEMASEWSPARVSFPFHAFTLKFCCTGTIPNLLLLDRLPVFSPGRRLVSRKLTAHTPKWSTETTQSPFECAQTRGSPRFQSNRPGNIESLTQ